MKKLLVILAMTLALTSVSCAQRAVMTINREASEVCISPGASGKFELDADGKLVKGEIDNKRAGGGLMDIFTRSSEIIIMKEVLK